MMQQEYEIKMAWTGRNNKVLSVKLKGNDASLNYSCGLNNGGRCRPYKTRVISLS